MTAGRQEANCGRRKRDGNPIKLSHKFLVSPERPKGSARVLISACAFMLQEQKNPSFRLPDMCSRTKTRARTSKWRRRHTAAGMGSPQQARYELKSVSQHHPPKEDTRGGNIISCAGRSRRRFSPCLRLLQRSPRLHQCRHPTLALGIGANTAIFSVISVLFALFRSDRTTGDGLGKQFHAYPTHLYTTATRRHARPRTCIVACRLDPHIVMPRAMT